MKSLLSLIAITLLGFSTPSHSAKQDVIYKKVGSVLRGELIEQDFSNGIYKIELMGGSAFNDTYSSLILDLGIGYAWKPMQLALHYQGYISDDYPDDVEVSNIHLQVGVHF